MNALTLTQDSWLMTQPTPAAPAGSSPLWATCCQAAHVSYHEFAEKRINVIAVLQ